MARRRLREARPESVVGITPWLGDPYEYPPPFAVLPRVALALTSDYQIVRAAWFGLSTVGFWLVYFGLARWVRGRTGATAMLLAPAIALAFPLIFGLQWGQAHLIVIAAAVAAMVQFARGRARSGGVLLAFAIASKNFPGLLLVHLAIRKRWRALLATGLALVALVGLAAVVLGPATLVAYVSEHLPRMASGDAFAFTETNVDNHAPGSLAWKLSTLGIGDGDRHVASLIGWAWGLVALGLTALASRRRGDRASDAMLWLGILCVATLRSPFAPMYTAIGTLWLLAMATGVVRPRLGSRIAIGVAWVLLQGFSPMVGPAINTLMSLPSQLITIAIALISVWPRRAQSKTPPAGTPASGGAAGTGSG